MFQAYLCMACMVGGTSVQVVGGPFSGRIISMFHFETTLRKFLNEGLGRLVIREGFGAYANPLDACVSGNA